MPYFMGIDIGTYESKGVIIDGLCNVIAVRSEKHGMENPSPNFFEHDAEKVWWGDFCKISHGLLEQADLKGDDITAVGASTLGADLVPVDENCVPLRKAILYGIDARAKKEIAYLEEYYGLEKILEFNGRPLCSNDIPPKILWLKNNEPEIHKKAYKLITGSTYIFAKLTGRYYVDRFLGLGSFAPLYNPETLQPDEEYVGMFCRPDQLADIEETVSPAGRVTKKAAIETGLAEGTPVIVGGDDSLSEAISTGVLETGELMLQFGSSLYLVGISDRRIYDKRVWSGGYIIPNTFSVQGGTNAAGTLTRWYRDNIFFDALHMEHETGRNAYESMMEGIDEIPIGSGGLLTLPYIAGERTPLNDPEARGVLCGLSIGHTRRHMYRSALESIGYSVSQHLGIFAENGVKIDKIYAVGGGTKNKAWIQIISDICGKEIHTAEVTIGAAFGDAAMAAIGVGHFADFSSLREFITPGERFVPNMENYEKYQKYRRLFDQLYTATKEIVHELNTDG